MSETPQLGKHPGDNGHMDLIEFSGEPVLPVCTFFYESSCLLQGLIEISTRVVLVKRLMSYDLLNILIHGGKRDLTIQLTFDN